MRGRDGLATAGGDASATNAALIRATDCDVINHYCLVGLIVGVAAHPRNLLYQLYAGVITLAKNGVLAVQTCVGNFCDKELRAVGIGSSIRIGHTAGTIELEVIRRFVLEGIAGITGSGPHRVAALNHKVGNDAVESGAVIKWDTVFFLVSDGAGPILGSGGQADEIGHTDWSLVRKEGAG